MDENEIPDIIELQDWLSQTNDSSLKKIYDATKYLSSPYSMWLETWYLYGKPAIRD